MFLQKRCNIEMQLTGSQVWYQFSLLMYIMQNNILLQTLLAGTPTVVIEGMTGFAKQLT
jgi:uncharacterized membrane protein YcaP (DUF421 family)